MSKYGVRITYTETRYIEVEAENEDEATNLASERISESEPIGEDDYQIEEVEKL